jgi:hypothetical protein
VAVVVVAETTTTAMVTVVAIRNIEQLERISKNNTRTDECCDSSRISKGIVLNVSKFTYAAHITCRSEDSPRLDEDDDSNNQMKRTMTNDD